MIDKILEQLSSTDPAERRDALESLYDVPCTDRILHAASGLLADPDRGVQEAASRLLIVASNESAATMTAAHICSDKITVRNLAGDTLVRMRGASVNALIPYVDHADKDVRKFAIDVLAQLPCDATVMSKIVEHLNDPDQNVISACVDAIGDLHCEEQASTLTSMFDKNEYLRPNLVSAASKLGQAVNIQFFVKALDDPDPVVQLSAAEALATRKDRSLLEVLFRKMNTVSEMAKPVILHSVVSLLESLNCPIALPTDLEGILFGMLDDADTSYVRAAVRGLKYYEGRKVIAYLVGHIGRSEAVDNVIFSVLKDRVPETFELISGTEEISDEKLPPIVRMTLSLIYDSGSTDPGFMHSKILEDIIQFINRSYPKLDADSKISVLSTLTNVGPSSSISTIRLALEDPETSVKTYALDLAGRIGPQFFLSELQRLSEDNDEDIRYAVAAMLSGTKPQQD